MSKMSASSNDFSSSDDGSFDELVFMRKHMNNMGDELYDKSKMLAKAQAKIAQLADELGKARKRIKAHTKK